VKRKRKNPSPVTGAADVLDTDAALSTATAPPPTPEGTGPGLEARVEELDAMSMLAPFLQADGTPTARNPVAEKWDDLDNRAMAGLHLKVEEVCNQAGKGGMSDAAKAAMVAKLALGPPPIVIAGRAPTAQDAKNWRDRKLKLYKKIREAQSDSGGRRIVGDDVSEELWRMLEVLFMPIAAAIIPKASDVAMAGGGMDAAERAQFELDRGAASSCSSSSSSLAPSSVSSSSSSKGNRLTQKELNRLPLEFDRGSSPFSAIDVHGGGEDAALFDDEGVELDVAPSTYPDPFKLQDEKDGELLRHLSRNRTKSESGNAAQRRLSHVAGDVQTEFRSVVSDMKTALNPPPQLTKTEMLEEARALKELYEAGYYDEEEYKAEQVALKKKYGRAAPLKSNKSKTKK
jgi:hypothetical protein